MNFSKEFTYGNKVFTDEVSSVDYQKLCKLLEAIIAWAVSDEIEKLSKKRCCAIIHGYLLYINKFYR